MNLPYAVRGEAISYRPEDAGMYIGAPSFEVMVSKALGYIFSIDQTLCDSPSKPESESRNYQGCIMHIKIIEVNCLYMEFLF
jgi:hypothetical protein